MPAERLGGPAVAEYQSTSRWTDTQVGSRFQGGGAVPQSLSNVLLHVIYSTKNREPYLVKSNLRDDLHAYLGGTLEPIKCPSLGVQAVADHVHVLCRLSRTMTIANLVEAMKTESSKWIKRHEHGTRTFQWQAGYAAFSVSASNAGRVKRYIEAQQAHHRVKSFQGELRAFLRRHQVKFDERYVWD
jgi:REP element-mobilizing transposase RayT